MSVTSCQQRILLQQPLYYNLEALPVEPSSAVTVEEALLYTFFVLDRSLGLTDDDVLAFMAETFPQYSPDTVQSTFSLMVRAGVFVILQPLCRNWCDPTCPAKTYAINKQLERLVPWGQLVPFLLQLAGGTQVATPAFWHWFAPNRDLQGSLIYSTKRPVVASSAW